jgi:hypothetical protein
MALGKCGPTVVANPRPLMPHTPLPRPVSGARSHPLARRSAFAEDHETRQGRRGPGADDDDRPHAVPGRGGTADQADRAADPETAGVSIGQARGEAEAGLNEAPPVTNQRGSCGNIDPLSAVNDACGGSPTGRKHRRSCQTGSRWRCQANTIGRQHRNTGGRHKDRRSGRCRCCPAANTLRREPWMQCR